MCLKSLVGRVLGDGCQDAVVKRSEEQDWLVGHYSCSGVESSWATTAVVVLSPAHGSGAGCSGPRANLVAHEIESCTW